MTVQQHNHTNLSTASTVVSAVTTEAGAVVVNTLNTNINVNSDHTTPVVKESKLCHTRESCTAAPYITSTPISSGNIQHTFETSYSFDLAPASSKLLPSPSSTQVSQVINDCCSDLSDILLLFDNNKRFGRDNNTGQCNSNAQNLNNSNNSATNCGDQSNVTITTLATGGGGNSNNKTKTIYETEGDKLKSHHNSNNYHKHRPQSILLKTESWKTVQNYAKEVEDRKFNSGEYNYFNSISSCLTTVVKVKQSISSKNVGR